jgi:GNAT superfamily N-acetyltransferase
MLIFQPIDLARHRETMIEFRRDAARLSDMTSPAPDDALWRRYCDDIAQRLRSDPLSCVHVWLQGELIGQIELKVLDDGRGLINLLYLIEGRRDRGYGAHLERYAETYFRQNGVRSAVLRVAATNRRALTFYTKHCWTEKAWSDDGLLTMEKYIPAN